MLASAFGPWPPRRRRSHEHRGPRRTSPTIRRLTARPPYTVFAYAAGIATILVAAFISDGMDRRLLIGGSFIALVTLGLVRGYWFAWLVLVTQGVGNLVVGRTLWWAVVSNVAMLALLLAPPTRRYVRRGRPRIRAWLRAAVVRVPLIALRLVRATPNEARDEDGGPQARDGGDGTRARTKADA